MVDEEGVGRAKRLIQQGASDERIEAATGLSLVDVIELRVKAAASPRGRVWPDDVGSEASSGRSGACGLER